MKKIILILIIVAIAVSAGLFLKSQKKVVSELPTPKLQSYKVDTTTASTKTLQETRQFLAQLLASKSAQIASKFSAEIKDIYVKENDIVTKGQLLISLDDTEISASLTSSNKQKKALKIDVANAKSSLTRNKNLLDVGAISQEKYDNSNVVYQNKLSSLQGIKEKIKQLQAQLTYLNIKAPFSGRVGSILVDAGNLAIPGRPIISLNSNDQKLIFSYAETSQAIVEGQKVFIDNKEVGMITRRYDDAKNALLVAEVKLSVALNYVNKGFLNIQVVTAQATGCSLPLNALLHQKDATFIMTYKDTHFEPLKVDVILQDKEDAILKECPSLKIATASEAKLALLPTLGRVHITEEK